MSLIRPSNPDLLTDLDVEYSHFHCCGDEDLVFLRCPDCGHIMVFCYECDTLFPDLAHTETSQGLSLTSEAHRVACSVCGAEFKDRYFLRPENVERYLPTANQVREAGFGHLLSKRRP